MSATSLPAYHHRQPGYLMVAVLAPLAVAAAIAGAVSGNSAPACLVAGVLSVSLALFYDLTVEVGEDAVRFRFGIGLIRKRVPLVGLTGCRPVRNSFRCGWGIHYIGRGWLYNVSGWEAVELSLRDGGRLRIGTDDPQGLTQAIAARLPPASP